LEGAIVDEVIRQWELLISETNWRKGDLLASVEQFNADGFAREVGGAVPDHLRRLREVSLRFPPEYRKRFPKLRWSYFLAAHDWLDRDKWLQLANDGDLTVSQMRMQRWERVGAPNGL
jgi:hypothetical protein